MVDSNLKQQLLELLDSFDGTPSGVLSLQSGMLDLFKQDIDSELNEKERKSVREGFSWFIDMYNPELQPRDGIVGKLQDGLDQIFSGNYRVSIEEVQAKVEDLKTQLS